MGAQGEALAAKVQQVSDQLIAAIQAVPDERWTAKTAAEGWSVAVTAHHAADGFGTTSQFVGAIANGAQLPPITAEMVDGGNAQHAQQFANCTKAETISMAREKSADAVAMLKGLSDDQLANTATLFFSPAPLSAAQIAEFLVVGHPAGHIESMQASA